MLTAIILALALAAFDWVGIAHLDETSTRRSKIGRANQAAMLANQKAICAKLGVPYVAPILPPVS